MTGSNSKLDHQIPLEEAQYHPFLLLLDEFEGEIDGKAKYHKSLFLYRNQRGMDESDWPFQRVDRGPTDEGFTALLDEYEKLGLVEVDEEEGKIYVYRRTDVGSRVIKGLRRGLSKLYGEELEEREEAAELIAELNMDRPISEIVEDEEIQDAKENPYDSDV